MEILIVIAIAIFGFAFFKMFKERPRLYAGAHTGDALRKAIIALKFSDNDFDVKAIGLDLMRLNESLASLTDSDINALEDIKRLTDGLSLQLNERLIELGIHQLVQEEWERQFDKEMEEYDK